MCLTADPITAAYESYRNDLVDAGLLIPLGVPGVYGRNRVFETVIQHFEGYVTRTAAHLEAEVMHFPPVLSRQYYLGTDHLQNFPNLMGSVHSFKGDDRG